MVGENNNQNIAKHTFRGKYLTIFKFSKSYYMHQLWRGNGKFLRVFYSWRGNKSAGADWGPRSWVCARLTLRSATHRHQRKFFSAHVWEVGSTKNLFTPNLIFWELKKCCDFAATYAAKISAGVDGWLSGGSSMRRPGARTPISASGNTLMFSVRWWTWMCFQR